MWHRHSCLCPLLSKLVFSHRIAASAYGVTCHPEAAAAPEGQSAPKDPQPETGQGSGMSTIPPPYRDNNLGVLRPSCAAQSLRDYAAPAAQDDSAICCTACWLNLDTCGLCHIDPLLSETTTACSSPNPSVNHSLGETVV